MSFLHPALLSLAALAAVPVILHFLMRPKPKRLLFPALRLIETRRKTNVRRLRLRHIWLLLLRIAIIALLIIGLARPLVPAAHYGLTARESMTLAIIGILLATAYAVVVRWWGQASTTPRHEFLYRRSVTRAVTGVAAAFLILFLVVWPYASRVSAEVADPSQILAEDRPVAAIFVFDSSRSMEYQFEGASRLDVAKRIALEHLASLPSGSRVAVIDSESDRRAVFQADLAAAEDRINSTETHSLHHSLEDRIRAAFELQEQDRGQGLQEQSAVPEELRRDAYVRAVYVFTDLAATAWSEATSGTLRERLEKQRWLQLYLLDVGVEEPVNAGLTVVRPSEEILISGNRETIRANVFTVGTPSAEIAVDLYLDSGRGPVKRNQAVVTPGASKGGTLVEFPLTNIEGPIVHGELRLTRSDPFAADDVRYFTITVEDPPKVLVVSNEQEDSFIWSEALRSLKFDVLQVQTSELAKETLQQFDAVYLINVTSPPDAQWQRLSQYVEAGGGLGVVLGTRVDLVSYNSDVAQSLLPGRLLTQLAFNPPELFRPVDNGHPIFQRFEDFDSGYGWLTNRDVKRHYIVEPAQGAGTIASYTFEEDRPALILKSSGSGRVAMLTTGVDTTEGWSDLALAGLPYLVFAEQLTQFISGRAGGRRNFVTDEDVVLRLERTTIPPKLLLRTPQFQQRVLDVPQDDRRIRVTDANEIGHYDITAPAGTSEFRTGFSMNLAERESDFTRLTTTELDNRFGPDRYSLARDARSLAVVVRDTTLGAELMPYVLILLVTIFCGEHLVANRFYDAEQSPDHS